MVLIGSDICLWPGVLLLVALPGLDLWWVSSALIRGETGEVGETTAGRREIERSSN